MACRGMTLADTDPHDPQAGQAVYWQRFLMISSFHFVFTSSHPMSLTHLGDGRNRYRNGCIGVLANGEL